MSTRLILLVGLSLGLGAARLITADQQRAPYPAPPARARVVIVEDPRSVIAFSPVAQALERMVDRGIVTLTGEETPAAAWRTLVSTQDVVGLKVVSSPGATSGTRPAVVGAVLKSLLTSGLPPSQIIIWDKRFSDLRLAGFVELAHQYGVQVAGSADVGYDSSAFYETALLGKLVWGDLEFGKKGEDLGRKSFVSNLLTRQVTKIINLTPLLNHNLGQVSGNLYTLSLASVDNTIRFEWAPNPVVVLSQSVPELYAVPEIGDRVVLNIVDALICQYQGEERTLLHYSTMLGQLRFSTDPVALDVLSIQELDRQRQRAKLPPVKGDWQIYTNATLLELGVSDTRLIDIIKVDLPPQH